MKRVLPLLFTFLLSTALYPMDIQAQSNTNKKALAILGDFWHGVAPLNRAIVWQMEEKGYDTEVIADYNVPFDSFSDYDLIVLSRYYEDDYKKLALKVSKPRQYGWLTPEQEMAFETYVQEGGNLFFHHDGIGYYPKGGAISRLAKAYFINHPPVVDIVTMPVGNYAGLNVGVQPTIIREEEYVLEIDTSATNVFMQSYSNEHGHAYQGWAHDYGKGKVVVFIPGHDRYVLFSPMIKQSISNIIDSFD